MTVKFINETVFKCMNEMALNGDSQGLNKWLEECNEEIERRENNKENIFPLQYEKRYLESLCKTTIEYVKVW